MSKTEKKKKEKSKLRKILEGIGIGIFVAAIGACAFVMIYSRFGKNKDNKYAPTKIGNLYLPVYVVSDSMEPSIPKNSMIFIKSVSPESIYNSYKSAIEKGKEIKIDLTFDDNYMPGAYLGPASYSEEAKQALLDNGKQIGSRTTYTNPMRTMTHRLFFMEVNENVELGKGRYRFYVAGTNVSKYASQQDQFQLFTEAELYGKVIGKSVILGGFYWFATTSWGLIVLILIPTLYMIISSVLDLFRKEEAKESEQIIENAKKQVEGDSTSIDSLSDKEKEKLKKQLLEKMMEEKRKENEN